MRRMMLMLCVLLVTLSSCSGNGVPVQSDAEVTLPPAANVYVAPIGDAALEYVAPATLYLPRHDGMRLIAVTQEVAFSGARLPAESLVRALLSYPGDGVASAVGGDVKLSLYGVNPVEVSRDVATVNLAASALQLDRKALYVASQSIANTLTELTEIRYVNVLVMDKQLGLDIASTLPMGALVRSVGEDVGAAYEQALSQRVVAGEDAAQKRLTALATLYFPLSSVDGVMPETRSLSFTSQALPDMAVRLLQALSDGPQQLTDSPALPLLSELLTEPPTVTEPEGGAGKQITLRFAYNFDDMLTTCGVSRASCMASICYTLCGFLPNVTGVTLEVGGERVESLRLAGNLPLEALLFTDGLQTRAAFAPFLLDHCTLYFTDGEKLVRVQRPVAYYQVLNPRFLLLELGKGPLDYDSVQGLQPVMPVGRLRDADVLGVSLSDRTLLVNFANAFAQLAQGCTEAQDRLLAYALVNTLFCGDRTQRIRFFVSGAAFTGFTQEIYWAGDFYKNPGLVRD